LRTGGISVLPWNRNFEMKAEKIFFVDDDLKILTAHQRQIRGRFQIEAAGRAYAA